MGGDAKLSEEHSESSWISLEEAMSKLTDFFHKELDTFSRLNLLNVDLK